MDYMHVANHKHSMKSQP